MIQRKHCTCSLDRKTSDSGPRDSMCDEEMPTYGMITIYHKDASHKNYTVPACKHGNRKDRCLRCSKLCEHGRGKVGCPKCNRCVHNQHKRLCKYCNDWTCNADGCRYKGHHFCSKSALKNHTQSYCPTPIVPPMAPEFQRLAERFQSAFPEPTGHIARNNWLSCKLRGTSGWR